MTDARLVTPADILAGRGIPAPGEIFRLGLTNGDEAWCEFVRLDGMNIVVKPADVPENDGIPKMPLTVDLTATPVAAEPVTPEEVGALPADLNPAHQEPASE